MGLFMFEYWLILWRWSSFSNIFLWRAHTICWDHSKTSSVQAREVFQWFNSSAVFTMHVATIRLVPCLFFCSDLLPANSQKPQIDSIDQSELVRKARDIRQHRQIRQTLFILTEVSSLISYIFVDIVIWNFFLMDSPKINDNLSQIQNFCDLFWIANEIQQGPRRGRGWGGGFSPPTFLQE